MNGKPDWHRHLDAVTRLIPGYDPWKTAGDCTFDYEAAQNACDFFPECLVHVQGEWAGKPLVLEPWQQAIVANLFGWKRADGTRRYRQTIIYVPRKNAKTTIAAGIALYLLFCDGEPGAEIYGAAANEKQAAICFDIAKGMVRGCPALAKRGKIFRAAITFERTLSSYHVISSKAATKHGYNPSGIIIDELHAQKDRDLVDVMTTAAGARRQPLTVFLTTADFDKPGICNETHKYASDVRDGIIEDRSFLPVIYEASRDDDWTSEKTWRKANPNLGVSVKLEFMREACKKAQEQPTFENTFKRLHLNIITEQADRWLQLAKWDACTGPMDVAALKVALKGHPCFGGLDLSSTKDLTAFALVFPPHEARLLWAVLVWCWAPQMNARDRELKDRVPYTVWAREGYLTLTPGNVVDYDIIRSDVVKLKDIYDIKEIAFDRFAATQIMNQLGGDGFEMVPFGQGFVSLSAPTKEVEKLVLGQHLLHGGNPLLRWSASNVAIERDAAENMKPSKKHSTERIDPIVATIMGLGRASARDLADGKSVYDSRGIIEL